MRLQTLAIIVLVCSSCPSWTAAEGTKATVYKIQIDGEERIEIKEKLKSGEIFDFEVEIKNAGASFSVIGQKAACFKNGCIGALELPVKILAKDNKGESRVKVRIKPSKEGRFSGRVELYTNRKGYRMLTFDVTADIVQ